MKWLITYTLCPKELGKGLLTVTDVITGDLTEWWVEKEWQDEEESFASCTILNTEKLG